MCDLALLNQGQWCEAEGGDSSATRDKVLRLAWPRHDRRVGAPCLTRCDVQTGESIWADLLCSPGRVPPTTA